MVRTLPLKDRFILSVSCRGLPLKIHWMETSVSFEVQISCTEPRSATVVLLAVRWGCAGCSVDEKEGTSEVVLPQRL